MWDSLGDVIWTLIVVFLWLAFLMVLFRVITDVFRSDDLSGGMKTLWIVVLLFLPYLGAFVYLIARGGGMAARDADLARQHEAMAADYLKGLVGIQGGSADQMEKAKELLDQGVINSEEFERLKAKALA